MKSAQHNSKKWPSRVELEQCKFPQSSQLNLWGITRLHWISMSFSGKC